MNSTNEVSAQLVSSDTVFPPRRVGLLAFGAVVLFMIYQVTVENLFAPLQSEMATELDLGNARSAVVSASCLLAFAVVQLPAGLLIDRFGVARLLPVIAALAGLSAFMFARSDGFVTAILARSLLGAAAAFVTPALASVSRGIAPANRFALLMGIGDMAIGIGGVLGVAGGNALENAVGWRNTLLIAAIVAIPIALALFGWVPRRWFSAPPTLIGGVHASPLASIKEVISQRTVRIAALVFAVSCGTVCGFGGMWNMKLAEGWAWNEQEATIITASFYVGLALFSPIAGWLGMRFGSRRTLMVSMWAALPLFLFWLLVPGTWPLWIDIINVMALGAALSANVLAFEIATHGLPTNRVGTAIAVVSLGGVFAGVILEIIPGLVAEHVVAAPLSKLQMANAIFAFSIALAIGATYLLPKRA
jgi:MFS family permease